MASFAGQKRRASDAGINLATSGNKRHCPDVLQWLVPGDWKRRVARRGINATLNRRDETRRGWTSGTKRWRMDPFASSVVFCSGVVVVVVDDEMGEAGPLPLSETVSPAPEVRMTDSPAPASASQPPPQQKKPSVEASVAYKTTSLPTTTTTISSSIPSQKPPVAYKSTPLPAPTTTSSTSSKSPSSSAKVSTFGDRLCSMSLARMKAAATKRVEEQERKREEAERKAERMRVEEKERKERAEKGESLESDEGASFLASFDFEKVMLEVREGQIVEETARLLEGWN